MSLKKSAAKSGSLKPLKQIVNQAKTCVQLAAVGHFMASAERKIQKKTVHKEPRPEVPNQKFTFVFHSFKQILCTAVKTVNSLLSMI